MDAQLVGEIISLDPGRLAALRLVRDLDLPQGAISGEFVRCAVFDQIHEHKEWTQLKEIEVVYWDPSRTDLQVDSSIETELVAQASRKPWKVTNLARDYSEKKNLKHALDYQLATASAVAVRLTRSDHIEVIAPYGIEDLLNGIVKPIRSELSGSLRRLISEQKWKLRFPKLQYESITIS